MIIFNDLTPIIIVWFTRPIAAGGSAQCEVELVPTSCGEVVVTATFLSKELDDVDGYYSVTVAG